MNEQEKLIPQEAALLQNLDKIAFTLDKAYMDYIVETGGDKDQKGVVSDAKKICSILPFENYRSKTGMSYEGNIRLVRIDQWAYDKGEKVIDCFKNVVSVFSESNKSLGLVIRRNPNNVEMYLAIQNTVSGGNELSSDDRDLLAASLRGNFPGSDVVTIDAEKTETVVKNVLRVDQFGSIACLCNVPTDKSEEYISQGIDKLLNGIVPKTDEDSYVIIVLAQALDRNSVRRILTGYEDLATALTPLSGYQFQLGHNSTEIVSEMKTLAHSEGVSNSIVKTRSFNLGISVGASGGYGYSRATGEASVFNDTVSRGFTKGLSKGTSDSTSYTYKSYVINDLIKKLEKNMERVHVGQASGLWCSASYVLAKDASMSKNIANFLRSLTQGDESFVEPAFVQEWSFRNDNGVTFFEEIKEYLKHFAHPVFFFGSDGVEIPVTPTANLSTNELARLFAFSRRSVPGLPVLQCAAFGRNAISIDGKEISGIELGNIYHMHKPETTPVELDVDSLTMHTFITGSTGSGKSNTVYHLLKKLKDQGKHFLVVEPAKGEYRDVFGDVKVYGTNPDISELLRINPFSFPKKIRVDEHIDRLISIFNVCWPMYAAMPAVLKDSIERAYINAGWDLETSKNKYGRLFPTFIDVLDQIEAVMDESQYSADSKGDYKGALLTRVRSLTNGINGLIFGANGLSDEALFEADVIVDISRVGSSETRSLIMGLLVMKLQEYRTAKRDFTDKLVHVTVLEEAHNLLKRTSTEQSDESSNLVGKSVEMLSNAIAEMRAFGEGFIIADQAPGLLDMAAIRNTNTKIILRLPEYSDRELVGRAVGLNDDQIAELAKLKRGVAAVYQNDWVEAVLCEVPRYEDKEKRKYQGPKGNCINNDIKAKLIDRFAAKDLHRLVDRSYRESILTANIPARAKCRLFDYLDAPEKDRDEIAAEVAYELLGGSSVVSEVIMKESFREQKKCLLRKLPAKLQEMTDEQFHSILSLVIYWHAHETERPEVKRLAQELLQSERARRVE